MGLDADVAPLEIVERVLARRSYVSAAADNPKIAFHWETSVLSIEGTETVTGITVRSDSGTSSLPCAGVFLYAGLIPNTGFLPGEIIKDERGAVIVDADGRTSVPTVFAVGAARAGYQGQGVNALSEGATAAIAAARDHC